MHGQTCHETVQASEGLTILLGVMKKIYSFLKVTKPKYYSGTGFFELG
jgi:hypothetical protein